MISKLIRVVLLGFALAASTLSFAQPYDRDGDRDRGGDRREVTLMNNWDRPIEVTIVSERRDERVRETWHIAPNDNTWLTHNGGRKLRVRATDRIKLRADMRPVRIGDVAVVENGHWVISARDVVRGQRQKERAREMGNR